MFGWLGKMFSKSDAGDALGGRGENLAASYLRNQGMKILERNFRTPVGEIDIVARLGQTIIFVEVKSRSYDDPRPEDQVDATKQHQLTKTAKAYLSRFGVEPPARFDVVAVLWTSGGRPPVIRHTENAFDATF